MRKAVSFILSLIFMIASGFTSYDSIPDVDHKNTRDSTIVLIQFENPEITISDERISDAWMKELDSKNTVDSTLIVTLSELNINVAKLINSQERRYEESVTGYLSRITGKEDKTVLKAIEKRNKTKRLTWVLSLCLILISSILAFHESQTRKGGYRRQIGIFSVCIFLSGLLVILTDRLLLMTINSDYLEIMQLLKLSG
jgi:hypothetical protein